MEQFNFSAVALVQNGRVSSQNFGVVFFLLSFLPFSPHPSFFVKPRHHVRCITARPLPCQHRTVFGKSKISLKCKHKKTTPAPISATQSLQNSLMIKADSETLHQFQECFQLLTDFFSCRLWSSLHTNLTSPRSVTSRHQHHQQQRWQCLQNH